MLLPFETEITAKNNNNNTKEKKSISPIAIKKGDLCSVNIHVNISLLNIKMERDHQVFGVFILYILSTFLLDLSYRTRKDGEKKAYNN